VTVELPLAVRLVGGLGNQLFQVAAALHLRDIEGRPVVLDRGWYSSPAAREPWRRLEVRGATDGIRIVHGPWRLQQLGSRLGTPFQVTEAHLSDDALARVSWHTLGVRGYFQFARIPAAVAPALRRAIGARIPEALDSAASDPYVAVHCRLGDYLSNTVVKDRFGVGNPAEMLARGQLMAATLGGLPVRVFTDSPNALAEMCPGVAGPGVEVSRAIEPWAVLAELARCSGMVMANSSLSWWAAFIATGLRGDAIEVQFPTPWYASASVADHLLLADGWTPTPHPQWPG